MTNISTMISQLEPSVPQEIFLVFKMPTDVSILSLEQDQVLPHKDGSQELQKYRFQEKKGI